MGSNELPAGFQLDEQPVSSQPIQQISNETGVPEGFTLDEEKYGGVPGAAKAAAAGAARMLTMSGSDWLMTKTGLVKPETLKILEEVNPKATLAGEVAGLVGSHFYGVGEAEDAIKAAKAAMTAAKTTGNAAEIAKATEAYSAIKNTMGAGDLLNPVKAVSKLGGKIGEGLGGGLGATTLGAAAEGALYGAQQASTEAALDDHDLTAEHLLHNVGYGALFGGGLGLSLGLVGKGIKGLPGAMGAASDTMKGISSEVNSIIPEEAKVSAPILDVAPEVKTTGVKPTSIEEIMDRNAKALSKGESIELPQKAVLEDAISRVPMEHPVHPMQIDSLSDQLSRNNYKILQDLGGVEGKALIDNEALQKKELHQGLYNAIQDISPGVVPTSNAVEGGTRAAEAFTKVIQDARNELGPKIGELKKSAGNFYHTPGIIDAISNPEAPHGNADLAKMFDTSGKDIAFKPFDSGWGIDRKTYSNVKTMITDLEKDPTDMKRLFNLRDSVVNGINPLVTGQASQQLTRVKAAMMDYIQEIIQKTNPNESVRNWFRKYAINEENAKLIEKKFGAEIGTDNFRSLAKNKPNENILDNIFRDTETVKAAKKILPIEDFNKMLADHLSEQRERVTTDKAFSSNKFGSYLKNNQDALREAFKDNPSALQKIQDINTIMRILPDSPPINPSGTAKTLWGILKAHSVPELLSNVKEYGVDKWNRQQTIDELNKKLAGKASETTAIEKMQSMNDKVERTMKTSVKNILNDIPMKGYIASKLTPKEYDEKKKQILSFANNPVDLHTKLTNATNPLYKTAPNVTGALQKSMINATMFLASKLPHKDFQGPFMKETEPTPVELAHFNRYLSVVNDPMSVLHQIKNRTLSNESLETLKSVYPKLYQKMQTHFLDQISSMKDPSILPYKTKMILSKFMGEPLHPSQSFKNIQSNQKVYIPRQAPNMQQPKPNQKGMANIKISSRMSLRSNDEN